MASAADTCYICEEVENAEEWNPSMFLCNRGLCKFAFCKCCPDEMQTETYSFCPLCRGSLRGPVDRLPFIPQQAVSSHKIQTMKQSVCDRHAALYPGKDCKISSFVLKQVTDYLTGSPWKIDYKSPTICSLCTNKAAAVQAQTLPLCKHRLCRCASTDSAAVQAQTLPLCKHRLCSCASTDSAAVQAQTLQLCKHRLCRCASTDSAAVHAQTLLLCKPRLCSCSSPKLGSCESTDCSRASTDSAAMQSKCYLKYTTLCMS